MINLFQYPLPGRHEFQNVFTGFRSLYIFTFLPIHKIVTLRDNAKK